MTVRSNPLPLSLLGLMLLPAIAIAGADEWLERMNHALHALDYEGRFVYQHGQTLEAMYISHEVIEGQEHERLMSLTGLPREVIRDDKGVICLVSGRQSPDTGSRPGNRQLAPVQPIRPTELSDYYHFELGDTSRVAGRIGQGVSILPRDDLRYGYWLLLDQDTALPLATATVNSQGQRISQLLFTDLNVGSSAGHPPQGLLNEQAHVTRMVIPSGGQAATPRWRFEDLPGGFSQTRYRRRVIGDDDHEVEHIIFSDGLATVSVYVEASDDPNFRPGVSRLGAVLALSRRLPGYQVTAVGEVPQATLERFLTGIHPITAAP